MDVLGAITSLMQKNGWTLNQLARLSGVPQSTLSGLYQRNNCPTIPTLEKICSAFGISLAEFFALGETVPYLTSEQKRLIGKWGELSTEHRQAIWGLIEKL